MGKLKPLSKEGCIRRCKEWLVIGWADAWNGLPQPRSRHCKTPKDLRTFRLLPDWTDEQLETFAAEALRGLRKDELVDYRTE